LKFLHIYFKICIFQLIIEKLIPFLLILPNNASSLDLFFNKTSSGIQDSNLTLEPNFTLNETQKLNISDAGTSDEASLPTFSDRKGHLTDLFLQNRSSTYPKLKGSPRNVKVQAGTKENLKDVTKEEGDLVDFIINQISKLNPLQPLNLTREDFKDFVVIEDIKHLLPESNTTLGNQLKEGIENLEAIRKKRLLVHQLPERPPGSFADYYNTNPSLYDQTQIYDSNNPAAVHGLPSR
jgi:hypothetical protein